jgi:hypothetical protein
MKKAIIIAALIAATLSSAWAGRLSLLGAGGVAAGGGGGCNGTIDLSKGCTLPMFGGL